MSTASVVVIGNFDGVHLGHRALIATARKEAQLKQHRCVVLTFWPHPHAIIRSGTPLELLHTENERRDALKSTGVDDVMMIPFTRDLSFLSWSDFIDTVLLRQTTPEAVFVGSDFRFGKNREGTAAGLKDYLKNRCPVTIVNKTQHHESDISSSRIRELIRTGHMTAATELLGAQYSIEGFVQHGDGRGKSIGFPTANLAIETTSYGQKLVPAEGVYFSCTELQGTSLPSITNVGRRPTFHQSQAAPLIETHILNFNDDIYGRKIRVQFHDRLRNEKKFNGKDALVTQLNADIAAAKQFWHVPN